MLSLILGFALGVGFWQMFGEDVKAFDWDRVEILATPMNEKYSEECDKVVNTLLDKELINRWEGYRAYADTVSISIWVENYPYGYGALECVPSIKGRPSRKTILRLRKLQMLRCQDSQQDSVHLVLNRVLNAGDNDE